MIQVIKSATIIVLALALTWKYANATGNVRACYYGDWARYRTSPATLTAADIDPFICTHLIASFAKVNAYGNTIEPQDSASIYPELMSLKQRNPNLKVMLAVGGYNHDNTKFMAAASSSSSRYVFAKNVLAFLKQYDFDGLDIDWEYPTAAGKQSFSELLKSIRSRFNYDARISGKRLLLTVAVSAGQANAVSSYDFPVVAANVDLVFLMSYDFHGSWHTETGHNSPLYAAPTDNTWQAEFNVNWAAQFYVNQGVPPNKLVIGFPTYGRTFLLTQDGNNGVAAPATGGPGGMWTNEWGMMAYFEVCEVLRTGATRYWDSTSKAAFLVLNNLWVTFDDDQSYCHKLDWLNNGGYAGAMVWSIDLDDHANICGLGKYPLLNYIKNNLGKSLICSDASDATLPPIPPTVSTAFPGTVATSKPIDVDCTGHLDELPFPDTADCSMFYKCTSYGTASHHACPPSLYFSPINRWCDYPGSVDCATSTGSPGDTTINQKTTTTTTTTSAPSDGGDVTCTGHLDGRPFADPSNCAKFYKCTYAGILSRHDCNLGLYFNPTNLWCDYPANVVCGEQPTTTTTTKKPTTKTTTTTTTTQKPTTTTTTPKPTTTQKPMTTTTTLKPTTTQMPTTTTQMPTTTTLKPTTTTESTGNNLPSCVGKPEGTLLGDPMSCGHYYQCVWGTRQHYPCPGGLYFAEAISICDWPFNVDCGTRAH